MSRTLNLLDYYTAGDPDYTNAFTGLNAAILASGGHIQVVIPPDPAPYETQQGLEITVPRVTVDIFGDITLTGTTPKTLIEAHGTGGQNLSDLLDGIVLNLWSCTLDGGGEAAAAAGYVYDTTDHEYDTIRLDNVNNYEINGHGNAHVTNGLISCLKVRRGFRGHVSGVEFSYAVHDNNIAITQNPGYFNKDDDSTWGYQIVERFITHHAKDFGFTAFNAKQVVFRHFLSYENGLFADDQGNPYTVAESLGGGSTIITKGAAGGGCSIEGTEDYEVGTLIESGEIRDCYTNGIVATRGGGTIRNVAIRDIRSASSANYHSAAVCLFPSNQQLASLICDNVTVDNAPGLSNAVRDGFRARNSGGGHVSFELRGHCRASGCTEYGFLGRGVENVFIGPDCVLTGNNVGGNVTEELLIDNNFQNTGMGRARVQCQFVSTGANKAKMVEVGDSEFSHCVLIDAIPAAQTGGFLEIDGGGGIDRACIQFNSMRGSTNGVTNLGKIIGTCTDSFVGANVGDFTAGEAVPTTATNKYGLTDVAIPDVSGSGTIENYINNDLLAGLRNSGTIAA